MFNLLVYIGYRLYSVLARSLPLWAGYKFADFIGLLVFRLEHRNSLRRAVIMQRILKDKINFNSAYKLVCRNIQYFNRDLVDFFNCGRLDKHNIDSFVEINGKENLDNALKRGRGIVLASAHMGSWEMIGIVSAVNGYPVYGMVWDVGNKLVSNMFENIRLSKGVGTAKSHSLRHILELLKKNKIIGIMLDVDGGTKGVPYTLWGYNVRLPRGPAAISRYTGSELVIGIMQRRENGGYKLYIEKPSITGTEEEVTIELFEIVKKYIENNPSQWHWIEYFFEYANIIRGN